MLRCVAWGVASPGWISPPPRTPSYLNTSRRLSRLSLHSLMKLNPSRRLSLSLRMAPQPPNSITVPMVAGAVPASARWPPDSSRIVPHGCNSAVASAFPRVPTHLCKGSTSLSFLASLAMARSWTSTTTPGLRPSSMPVSCMRADRLCTTNSCGSTHDGGAEERRRGRGRGRAIARRGRQSCARQTVCRPLAASRGTLFPVPSRKRRRGRGRSSRVHFRDPRAATRRGGGAVVLDDPPELA